MCGTASAFGRGENRKYLVKSQLMAIDFNFLLVNLQKLLLDLEFGLLHLFLKLRVGLSHLRYLLIQFALLLQQALAAGLALFHTFMCERV